MPLSSSSWHFLQPNNAAASFKDGIAMPRLESSLFGFVAGIFSSSLLNESSPVVASMVGFGTASSVLVASLVVFIAAEGLGVQILDTTSL